MKNRIAKAFLAGLLCILASAAVFEYSSAGEAVRVFIHIDSEAYSDNTDVRGAAELFIDLLPSESISLVAAVYSGGEYDYCKTFELNSINDRKTVKSFIGSGYKDVRSDSGDSPEETDGMSSYLIYFTDKGSVNSALTGQYGANAEIHTVSRVEDVASLITMIYDDSMRSTEALPRGEGVFAVEVEGGTGEAGIVLFGDDISTPEITNPLDERADIDGKSIYQLAGKGYLLVKLISPTPGVWLLESGQAQSAVALMFTGQQVTDNITTDKASAEEPAIEEKALETPQEAVPTPDSEAVEVAPESAPAQNKPAPERRIAQMRRLFAECVTISVLALVFAIVYFYGIKLNRPFNALLIYSVENDNEIIDTGSISLRNSSGRFVFENGTIDIKERFSVVFFAADNPDIIKVKNQGGNAIYKSTLPQKRKFKIRRGKAICIKAEDISVFVTFLNV